MKTRLPSAALTAVLFGSTLISGCGSSGGMPPAGMVIGRVTHKGQPLPGGTVIFSLASDPTKRGAGLIGPDGSYKCYDAPPGDTKVTLVAPDPKARAYPGQAAPKGAVKDIPTDAKGVTSAPPKVVIPAKYVAAASTPLAFTVRQSSDNVFDIELTD